MAIRNLVRVPLRSNPSSFSEDMEWLLSNLVGWTTEVNETADEIELLAFQTNSDALSLAENTPSVLAVANFKGLWSSLSGTLNVPATVYHLGVYWVLASNVADVSTAVPGTSSSWIAFPMGNHLYNVNHGII